MPRIHHIHIQGFKSFKGFHNVEEARAPFHAHRNGGHIILPKGVPRDECSGCAVVEHDSVRGMPWRVKDLKFVGADMDKVSIL